MNLNNSNGGRHLADTDSKNAINAAKLEKKIRKLTKRKIGFTNKLAIYLVLLLTFSLVLGFYLALESIKAQYTGALICWSCVVAPLDACLGIVLARVVEKSRAENLGPNGEGIAYAAAQASQFVEDVTSKYQNSDQFKKFMNYAKDVVENEMNTASSNTDNTESVFDADSSDADASAFATAEESDEALIDSPEI